MAEQEKNGIRDIAYSKKDENGELVRNIYTEKIATDEKRRNGGIRDLATV
jgi:hypothetical protein